MVNENEMQQPDNSGVNIMNGFALDEQNQDGFFKTTRYYLEPGKSTNHLLGTSIARPLLWIKLWTQQLFWQKLKTLETEFQDK